ncbi:Flp pilus assembly protein CpaB [Phenylobacterium sp.]|uniref:Flp pilus assembly protein CpaB n=1 Tax=Phenylobacterium sp. TaxID=1871053 RepID=UPI002DE41CED|nr:Flp pilus assembly protein CpaB [Phenylobacterium sp.]
MLLLSARRLKFLSLALLMSGGTVVLTHQWLQGAEMRAATQARAQGPAVTAPQTRVLVVRSAVPAGTILRPDQVQWQAWPTEAVNAAYFTQANSQIAQVQGAVARSSIAAGQPLTRDGVVQPGDRSFMAAVLRPGYRAVTINVSASTAVAGFVMPGDHVDLILSRNLDEGGQAKRFVSETVLSDVRVVGLDQRANDAKDKDPKDPKKDIAVPQTATLEVTPKGAEVVAVVGELGKLSLSLRSLADGSQPAEHRVVTRTSDRDATQMAAVRPAARKATAAAAKAPQVEVIRGGQSSTVAVAGGGQS